MFNDNFGNVIFQEKDIVNLIYNGHLNSIDQILVEDTESLKQFQDLTGLQLNIYKPLDINLKDFDTICQNDWFIPPEYISMDIEDFVLSKCSNPIETQRAQEELAEFRARNMIVLLKVLKYVVDTLHKNNIVWGVGRGSSVASFVLYLLEVHKINSLKYDLDWREFLR